MAKRKVPTTEAIKKQKITRFLEATDRSPLLIVKVYLTNRIKTLYAALTTNGIEVFDFKHGAPVSVQNSFWSEMIGGTVDHYAMKSVFTFDGNSSPWTLETLEKGKEFAQMIVNLNCIDLVTLPRAPLNKILGYRSKTRWKMATASLFYLIAIIWILPKMMGGGTEAPTSQATTADSARTSIATSQSPVQAQKSNAPSAQAPSTADSKQKSDTVANASSGANAQSKAEPSAKQQTNDASAAAQTAPVQPSSVDQAPAPAPQPAPVPAPQQAEVKIVSILSPVPRNGTETVVAEVQAGSTASIEVDYKSGPSHAQGLEDKTADSSGRVSWSWHVGGRTTLGTWPVYVTDNGQTAQASFEVVH